MSRLIQLNGIRFGRLSVVSLEPKRRFRQAVWRCVCDCGNTKLTVGNRLRNGLTRSCGCLALELLFRRNFKHGLRSRVEYGVWKSMIYRCLNPKNAAFKHYGGRGIKVCDKWLNSFAAFLSDMGKRPPGREIDRIDNNGDYVPTNCRWATRQEQMSNTRKNRRLIIRGKSKTVTQWAAFVRKRPNVVRYRLKAGWKAEAAVFTPLLACGRPRRID